MSKRSIFIREDRQIINDLWKIVHRELGVIDDVGCDWFTVGNQTYISNLEWHVSDDPEIAKIINAINCLGGFPELVYKTSQDAPGSNLRELGAQC